LTLRSLALTSLAALAFLFLVNALLFRVFFPDGPVHVYAHPRAEPLLALNALGLVVTALGLVLLAALTGGGPARSTLGALLAALLTALPSALHTVAVTEESFRLGPVAWTALTWAATGTLIGSIARRPDRQPLALAAADER
jgi:hypothetical protein